MLRSVISRTSFALAGSRRAAGTHLKGYSNPSTSTSVLLTRLPNSVVDTGLKDALKDLITRKVELEPGCSLHFVNECEAHVAAKAVEAKFSTKVQQQQCTTQVNFETVVICLLVLFHSPLFPKCLCQLCFCKTSLKISRLTP